MAQQTHTAIVTTAPGAKLSIIEVPTERPTTNEVRVVNYWTSSTPLDLHVNDGHLGVENPPLIMGEGVAGKVVEVGPEVKNLKLGDKVFGFTFRDPKEKAHQEYVIAPENMLAIIPEGFSMQQAVTVPDNFITILNVALTDFGMDVPWPKPATYAPIDADEPVLIWGGSSSTGMYAIQFFSWLGYKNVYAVASGKHHETLKSYGAKLCFDYRGGTDEAVRQVKDAQRGKPIKYILDCIGSLDSSMRPVSKIATEGTTAAVLLPVIVKDAAEGVHPEYSFDVQGSADWAEGVTTRGVRTFLYLSNPFMAEKGQPEIMPALMKAGVIKPNDQLIVEGDTMLERAEKAMTMLRNKVASGQRLVWRVADEDKA